MALLAHDESTGEVNPENAHVLPAAVQSLSSQDIGGCRGAYADSRISKRRVTGIPGAGHARNPAAGLTTRVRTPRRVARGITTRSVKRPLVLIFG